MIEIRNRIKYREPLEEEITKLKEQITERIKNKKVNIMVIIE